VWLLRTAILTELGDLLVEDDGPHHGDEAVVMAGDEYGTRVLAGAKLVTEGYAPYALVSSTYQFCPCESSTAYAKSKGYPASLFREFAHRANSTREEVQLLDDYFHAHAIHTVLLVTSNYHTRRAARLMRQQDPALKLWVVPASDPYFSPSTWWRTREGQKTFAKEWAKTVASWLGD
jgi:uncharacterized SAM-binding protein YcdF (DUF218 family)